MTNVVKVLFSLHGCYHYGWQKAIWVLCSQVIASTIGLLKAYEEVATHQITAAVTLKLVAALAQFGKLVLVMREDPALVQLQRQ